MCKQAKDRLKAIQKVKKKLPFAQAAYDEAKGKPVKEIDGFKNITNDRAALAKLGLSPELMTIPGTKFQATVFQNGPNVIVSFKGTDPLSASDWHENFEQGIGRESEYYNRAKDIAKRMALKRASDPLCTSPPEFVGHSLGGGLASAAAAAIDAPATTFNSAGLHANNISDEAVPHDVTAVKVRGEILTSYVNKLPMAPDVYASEEVMLDPPPSFGRDTVIPLLGSLAGKFLGSYAGPLGIELGSRAGAFLARAVALHLTGAIEDSLKSEENRAIVAENMYCK